jgi:predicted AAA+ superfamily ATPase
VPTQPVRILVGPRQCGKSSLLERLRPPSFRAVTLDDITMRDLA